MRLTSLAEVKKVGQNKLSLYFFAWRNYKTETYRDHGYGEVWPELVVGPGLCGAYRVLVDASAVDKVGPLLSRRRRRVHPELRLKVVLYSSVPLLVPPRRLASCKTQGLH